MFHGCKVWRISSRIALCCVRNEVSRPASLLAYVTGRGNCSESLLGSNHSLDTVVHVLDEVLLRAAKSALVGDIEDAVRGIRVLSTGSTDLDVVLVSDSLESVPVLHELLQADVNGSAKGCSEVGRA